MSELEISKDSDIMDNNIKTFEDEIKISFEEKNQNFSQENPQSSKQHKEIRTEPIINQNVRDFSKVVIETPKYGLNISVNDDEHIDF